MKNLIKALRALSYRRQVRRLRQNPQAGDQIVVLSRGLMVAGVILNYRRYQYGGDEVHFRSNETEGVESFSGWFPVEQILPLEGRS